MIHEKRFRRAPRAFRQTIDTSTCRFRHQRSVITNPMANIDVSTSNSETARARRNITDQRRSFANVEAAGSKPSQAKPEAPLCVSFNGSTVKRNMYRRQRRAISAGINIATTRNWQGQMNNYLRKLGSRARADARRVRSWTALGNGSLVMGPVKSSWKLHGCLWSRYTH